MTLFRRPNCCVRFVFLALLACFSAAERAAPADPLQADMVVYNGKILTADNPDPNNFRTALAVAILNGQFLVVGSNEEAMQYAGSKTQKIDLGGRMVLPGLVETHDHIYGAAAHFFPKGKPQVGSTIPPIFWTNKADFLAQVRTAALSKKPGEWIITSPESEDSSEWASSSSFRREM